MPEKSDVFYKKSMDNGHCGAAHRHEGLKQSQGNKNNCGITKVHIILLILSFTALFVVGIWHEIVGCSKNTTLNYQEINYVKNEGKVNIKIFTPTRENLHPNAKSEIKANPTNTPDKLSHIFLFCIMLYI